MNFKIKLFIKDPLIHKKLRLGEKYLRDNYIKIRKKVQKKAIM